MASRETRDLTFSEEEIQELFGHEAAEDERPERLREYYLKSSVYEQVANDLPLRILVGHKGIGKSALFQIAMHEDHEQKRLTLTIRPDDVIGLGEETTDFLATVRSWKAGLTELLARRAISTLGGTVDDDFSGRLRRVGGVLVDFLRQSLTDPTGLSFTPAKKQIADHFLRTSEISVYVDDLDRGWQGRPHDITRISALLSTIRDISNENRGIRFRISLRSDVYFLVRTSDESTDKIEGSVVWQAWTNHEIYVLLAKRIETFYGRSSDLDQLMHQPQRWLSSILDPVFEERFRGRGHWSDAPTYRVLMSLIRKRPRDLVKLCTLAARDARQTNTRQIKTANLQHIFEEYSQGRIQDTVNEFRSELPDIERLLFGMKPSKRGRQTKAGYVYETAALIQKLKAIQEQGTFTTRRGVRLSERELAAFLYKINFITARKELPDGSILRRYFEDSRYLQSEFADFGFDWEVHPAYRWALQPDDPFGVYDSVRLSSDTSG